MPLNSFIATGSYVNDCTNGLQDPITGEYVYTGFFNQCASDGIAYYSAKIVADNLRTITPCIADPTTTTTTTSTTTTAAPETDLQASGFIFDWTGNFTGATPEYYDITAWGKTNGYLSGNQFSSNQYFSQLSANDLGGYGVVLAVVKESGLVTGFGSNYFNQLDVPTGLTGIIQVSVGYDHVLALKNDSTVTGWGRDNWSALDFNSGLSSVQKVCAGMGGSVFLLLSGYITGTNTVGGGYTISYPTGSGYKNIDHSSSHVLAVTSGGLLTGFGRNSFGEASLYDLNGVSEIFAGISTSMVTYNGGNITGYGTLQSKFNTPNINKSGVKTMLKGHIGSVLKKNQNVQQWVAPWPEGGNIVQPSYLNNNIVDISQGVNFTAAIFKRKYTSGIIPTITGSNYLWKVTYVGGTSSYGGISLNDLYPPLGTVIQSCDGYSFALPTISSVGQDYTGLQVPNCSPYAGTHSVIFNSIESQKLLNINYSKSGYNTYTGWAATGITTGDYWNHIYDYNTGVNTVILSYSDGTVSPISGGELAWNVPRMSGITGSHSNSMYMTAISGSISPYIQIGNVAFRYLPTGNYKMLIYGHGPESGQNSLFYSYLGGVKIGTSGTTTGVNFNSTTFTEGVQYVTQDFYVPNTSYYVNILFSGFLNGIQFVRFN